MKSEPNIYGNLALQPETASRAIRPDFSVVSGGSDGHRVFSDRSAQICAPDVYARASAKPSSLPRSFVFTALLLLFFGASCLFASTYLHVRAQKQEAVIDALDSRSVTVEEGDSLWSIASRHEVDGLPVSQSVELIKTWNSLDDSNILPGSRLIIPTRAS